MNEADTCRKLVRPKLVAAGWDTPPHEYGETGQSRASGDAEYWPVFNLDLKNPNAQADLEHLPPVQLVASVLECERHALMIFEEMQARLANVQIGSGPWPTVALDKVLTAITRPETVEPEKTYRLLGARWYAGGLYVNDVKSGAGVQAKTLYKVERGDFVYNRLFAWTGSFALAGDEVHGCYVSNEFKFFDTNSVLLDAQYLRLFFSQQQSWSAALARSSGGTPTSRNRLKEEKFLKMTIPLPPLSAQRRIVALVEPLTQQLPPVKIKANAAFAALLPAILAGAFAGQL